MEYLLSPRSAKIRDVLVLILPFSPVSVDAAEDTGIRTRCLCDRRCRRQLTLKMILFSLSLQPRNSLAATCLLYLQKYHFFRYSVTSPPTMPCSATPLREVDLGSFSALFKISSCTTPRMVFICRSQSLFLASLLAVTGGSLVSMVPAMFRLRVLCNVLVSLSRRQACRLRPQTIGLV
jgi:hypothetical protein